MFSTLDPGFAKRRFVVKVESFCYFLYCSERFFLYLQIREILESNEK